MFPVSREPYETPPVPLSCQETLGLEGLAQGVVEGFALPLCEFLSIFVWLCQFGNARIVSRPDQTVGDASDVRAIAAEGQERFTRLVNRFGDNRHEQSLLRRDGLRGRHSQRGPKFLYRFDDQR